MHITNTKFIYDWLATGVLRARRAEIALATLDTDHNVVATTRNVVKAQESYIDIKKKGRKWLILDTTSNQGQNIGQKAVKEYDLMDMEKRLLRKAHIEERCVEANQEWRVVCIPS
jgi:hypothetical protein